MPDIEPQGVNDNSTSKMGVWMLVAAWIIVFGLLIAYFSGMLDKQYNPNQSPQSKVSQQGVEVILKRNRQGHYVTSGLINGKEVTFLLDTGATSVSIGAHLRDYLGLQPGQRFQALTANGPVTVAYTNINELQIGDIRLLNVDANLNPGLRSDEILLGMSALKHLEWSQRGDTLTIRTY